MNQEYTLAGKGLRYLFWSQILALLAVVVGVIPVLGWIAAFAMMLVGAVLEFVGPYTARNAHPGFQTAFYAALISIVVAVLSGMFKEGLMAAVVAIVSTLLSFAITYFVCSAAGALLSAKGDNALADRAGLIWKLYGGCAVVEILATVLGGVPILGAVIGVINAIASIVSLVAYVMLILFYYQASNSLGR